MVKCKERVRTNQSPEAAIKSVLRKMCPEICRKITSEHPCGSVISIKLLWDFIEITLLHGCSPVNLLHSFRTPFLKNTYGRLLLSCLELFFKQNLHDNKFSQTGCI